MSTQTIPLAITEAVSAAEAVPRLHRIGIAGEGVGPVGLSGDEVDGFQPPGLVHHDPAEDPYGTVEGERVCSPPRPAIGAMVPAQPLGRSPEDERTPVPGSRG